MKKKKKITNKCYICGKVAKDQMLIIEDGGGDICPIRVYVCKKCKLKLNSDL